VSTATHIGDGRVVRRAPGEISRVPLRSRSRVATDRRELPGVFADTVRRYLLAVLPQVSRELAHWRGRAAEIPNPLLRQTAGVALDKRGNIEGAALFATLAPAAHRRRAVRALVAFQTAYNYLDALSELPSEDPVGNGYQLHQGLLAALALGAPHPDYYAHNQQPDDGGYLTDVLGVCRCAVSGLPSFPAVAPTARHATARIIDFQALNLSERHGGHDALRRWAAAATPAGSSLAWWETAASGGSSLGVHALVALAANKDFDRLRAQEIERAYFPWIGALHTLLDSLVDRREDQRDGLRSLLEHYHSQAHALARLTHLARRSLCATERLPNPHAHRVILTAMCSYYLSAPECDTPEARTITRALIGVLGVPLNIAILMFRTRRRCSNYAIS
jgi:tetraprenyl-beta-curcumene synthase